MTGREQLKCALTACGGPLQIQAGTAMMLLSFANNLDILQRVSKTRQIEIYGCFNTKAFV